MILSGAGTNSYIIHQSYIITYILLYTTMKRKSHLLSIMERNIVCSFTLQLHIYKEKIQY